MDVNGTVHHLVIGQDGWLGAAERAEGLRWHAADSTVRLASVPFVFPERPGNPRVGPQDRRGAARDRYGNWFWIGADHREVRMQSAGTRGSVRYWPRQQPCKPVRPDTAAHDPLTPATGDFTPSTLPVPPVAHRLSGLAVTTDHHLVVGAPALSGVLVIDLHAGGPPRLVRWPAPVDPVDMAGAPDGGVWVLDNGAPGGPARLWFLDRDWRVRDLAGLGAARPRPADFVAVAPRADTAAADTAAADAVAPGSPAPVRAVHAVAVEALPDGTVLVLDRGGPGPAEVVHLRDGTELARWSLGPLRAPVDLAFDPDGAGDLGGTLHLAEEQGDQAFALTLAGSVLLPAERYLPMRLFTGKALVAAGGRVHYDLGELWLPLVDRRTPRYLTTGSVDLPAFVAAEPGTVWHRLTLDARIPPGTAVRLLSRAADDPAALRAAAWQEEPAPYRRHLASELPYHRYGDTSDAGTFETLLQRATGRHLQVRLLLTGDGRRTPRLWALRAYAPRFSYLHAYLPDVYQEDPASTHFLERYLANTEGLLTTLEGLVADAQTLFDGDTVGAEHLDWLARWVGATLDPGWDEARSRLLLRHAVALFGRRGTSRGLVEAIRLATDPCPDSSIFDGAEPGFGVRVVEQFRVRRVTAAGAPASGPRTVPVAQRWQPTDGRAELDRRWREHVTARRGTPADVATVWGRDVGTANDTFADPFPPRTPSAPTEVEDRRTFLVAQLAVGYADVDADDVSHYRTFLRQRYGDASDLAAAWGLAGASVPTSFEQVWLPGTAVPPDGRPLHDWVDFVSAYLPTVRAAHRFTVLVPVPLGATDAERADRVAQVARVVDRERPAHTLAEVRPYWAAFRLGEARLGLESTVAGGSRFTALVLGSSRLAAAGLAGGHPWDVPDRWIVGRNRVHAHVTTGRETGR